MTKRNWPALALLAAAAVILRAAQYRAGFDETGLAVRGNLPGLLLPIVLVLAAAYSIFTAWKLPAKRGVCGDIVECFRFTQSRAAVSCVVAGVFLVIPGAALSLLADSSLAQLLLSVFALVGALCVLYAAFALCRGAAVQGVALLVPVCALIVYTIFLYRADASNPVLERIYIELLAIAALTYSALERAAFAFRNGSPRAYLPAGAMAFVLSLAAAAELKSLTELLMLGGCALIEAGFLCAARFEEKA